MIGSKCLGCGTEWDFSLAMAVQQGEVPHFCVVREEGAQAGSFAQTGVADSPFGRQPTADVPKGPWEAKHFQGFQKEVGNSAFAKAAIPKAAVDLCPSALRSYLPLLCFGKVDTKGYKETLGIFETKAEAGDEAAKKLMEAVAIGRIDAPAIRPGLAKPETKPLTAEQERQQVYSVCQAAINEVAKTNKAVEFAHREEQKAREEIIRKENELAAAKENFAKKVAFTKECGIKHKAACAAQGWQQVSWLLPNYGMSVPFTTAFASTIS